MFDGVKICYYDMVLVRVLHENAKLEFILHVNAKTGEVKRHTADYKALKITTFPSGRIEIKGSLHKYFNGGLHNHDNFTIDNVKETIRMLKSELDFDPNRALVQNLEFGVNLSVPFEPSAFIESLISFKFKSFNTMGIIKPGFGKEHFIKQYGIKIYNKGLQYGTSRNILRIEKKVLVMCALNFGKLYLSDLTNPDLWYHCKKQLVQLIDDILINDSINYDLLVKNEQRNYRSVIDETQRTKLTRDQRKRYKKGFNMIIEKYGSSNYKDILFKLISDKCDELVSVKVHTF